MAAMPELAPRRRTICSARPRWSNPCRVLAGTVAYRTFDADSTEVLRLRFRPRRVTAGVALSQRDDLTAEGYVIQPLGGGDFAVRIRHDHARLTRISG